MVNAGGAYPGCPPLQCSTLIHSHGEPTHRSPPGRIVMGASTPHPGRWILCTGLGIALAAALALPARATPIFGGAIVDFYTEASAGAAAGVAFNATGAGELVSGGVGHPILPHAAGDLVGTGISFNTFLG